MNRRTLYHFGDRLRKPTRGEGFNNKIRWLIRQAYGYRDYRYFRLKVFDPLIVRGVKYPSSIAPLLEDFQRLRTGKMTRIVLTKRIPVI